VGFEDASKRHLNGFPWLDKAWFGDRTRGGGMEEKIMSLKAPKTAAILLILLYYFNFQI
jgi:hypothetical protein